MFAVVEILDEVETSMELRSAIHLEQEITCKVKVLATFSKQESRNVLEAVEEHSYQNTMPIDINPLRHAFSDSCCNVQPIFDDSDD